MAKRKLSVKDVLRIIDNSDSNSSSSESTESRSAIFLVLTHARSINQTVLYVVTDRRIRDTSATRTVNSAICRCIHQFVLSIVILLPIFSCRFRMF